MVPDNTKKKVVLMSAGAAVGLSAAAVVLLDRPLDVLNATKAVFGTAIPQSTVEKKSTLIQIADKKRD